MQYPTPKYQYVQLVAYEVPTSVLTGLLPVTSTLKPDAAQRLPVPDALNRAQHLLDVLQWARQTIPDDLIDFEHPLKQSSTLKIFMAPEFYFRATPEGYSWHTVQYILDYLRAELKDPMLSDWLIVPGTICSHQEPPSVFFNTASIIKGGPEKMFTFVHKQRKAERDNVPALYDDPGLHQDFRPILEAWEERKARIFTVDGITFGLDVCVDHSEQVLKRVCIEWPTHEKGRPAPPIDVHLITSCGMDIEARSVSARKGGWVFLCDGLISKNADWKHSMVKLVSQEGTGDLNREAELSGIDMDDGWKTVTEPIWQQAVPNKYAIQRPQGATRWFENRVVCYPRVKLFH